MQQVDLVHDLDFYIRIFNSLIYPVFVKNEHLDYVVANKAFCEIVGSAQGEIIGKKDHHFFPPERCIAFMETDLNLLTKGITGEAEEFATTRDGSKRIFQMSKSLVMSPDGKKHILGIATDITEKSRLFNKLYENELLIRTMVDNSSDMVMIHVEGKILYRNQAMAQLLCQPGGLFIDSHGASLNGKAGRKTMKAVLVYLANKAILQQEEVEIQFKSPKGKYQYFLLKTGFISFKGKNAIMSVLVDITEKYNLDAYLLNKILETEDRDRKIFATDLHDDLGPLLSSIKIHLGLEETLSDPLKYHENVLVCKKLINEAFKKIRIITNHINPGIIEMFGLDAAIQSFLHTLQVDQALSIHFVPALDGRRFSKEFERHVFRIICELINNSIKHSGGTKVFLRLNYSNHCLILLYADNGIGYNLEETLRKSTGMGLSNLFYRVNAIGGELDFLNKKGKTYVRIRKNFRENKTA
jgi:PAS domain S-box-containing protein